MIGRPIEHYVRINFDSFVEIVDMIGGIDINVPKTIHDEEYPTADYGVETFHLAAGMQHLDGTTALQIRGPAMWMTITVANAVSRM